MKPRWRLGSYILLNIIVSALVTGILILVYELIRPSVDKAALTNPCAESSGTDGVSVSITGIPGAGTIDEEQVIIQNNGSQELDLTGWYLKDDKGATYTFPELTLYPEATVQIHTRAGTNRLPDLYWGRSAPVWTSGELAALYDAQNIARAFYRVP